MKYYTIITRAIVFVLFSGQALFFYARDQISDDITEDSYLSGRVYAPRELIDEGVTLFHEDTSVEDESGFILSFPTREIIIESDHVMGISPEMSTDEVRDFLLGNGCLWITKEEDSTNIDEYWIQAGYQSYDCLPSDIRDEIAEYDQ